MYVHCKLIIKLMGTVWETTTSGTYDKYTSVWSNYTDNIRRGFEN